MATVAEAEASPPHPTPHPPARQVVLSAVALWITYFVLITVRGLVVEMGEFSELLWRRALVTLAGIAITLLAWPVLRRFDGRGLSVRIAAALVIMLPAALALAIVNQQAFAPVEARMLQKDLQAVQVPMSAPTSSESSESTTITIPGVKVRHDLSGNVLIDVGGGSADVPSPPPPPPPPPPAPEAVSPPVPGVPITIRKGADGSSITMAPGVVIRRNVNGTAEIRAGNTVIQADPDEADDIARDLEQARADAEQARHDADEDVRRAVRDALDAVGVSRRGTASAPPAPPSAPVVARPSPSPSPHVRPASTAKPAAARTASATHPAPATASSPAAAASPAGAASASPAPSPSPSLNSGAVPAITVIRKLHDDEGLWRQLTDVALGRYFLLIAWAALYLALGNGEMARAAERREGEYRRAAKAAELRSLRYQVNPHFLFNTLNSLSALVMVGRSEQAERMIQSIAGFYRQSLTADPTGDVPLTDEIALQRAYLDIEAVRFPDRLRTEFDIPEHLRSACVPGMILQPLVENSIKYAVSATTRPVTIRITAREAEGLLVLTVADDGPAGPSAPGGTGIGLGNVRNRLEARFGAQGRVEGGPLPAGGYATVLTLPVVWKDC